MFAFHYYLLSFLPILWNEFPGNDGSFKIKWHTLVKF